MNEVSFGLEIGIGVVLDSFGQDTVEHFVAERKIIGCEVILHILCYGKIANLPRFVFNILEDSLFPVPNHQLDKHCFYLAGLLADRSRYRLNRRRGRRLGTFFFSTSFSCLLFASLNDALIHLIDERSLVYSETLNAFVKIRVT